VLICLLSARPRIVQWKAPEISQSLANNVQLKCAPCPRVCVWVCVCSVAPQWSAQWTILTTDRTEPFQRGAVNSRCQVNTAVCSVYGVLYIKYSIYPEKITKGDSSALKKHKKFKRSNKQHSCVYVCVHCACLCVCAFSFSGLQSNLIRRTELTLISQFAQLATHCAVCLLLASEQRKAKKR